MYVSAENASPFNTLGTVHTFFYCDLLLLFAVCFLISDSRADGEACWGDKSVKTNRGSSLECFIAV